MQRYFKKLGIIAFIIMSAIIFSCDKNTEKIDISIVNKENYGPKKSEKYFIVLPHHSLTSKAIDKYYKDFSNRHKNIKNIVIISPEHYNIGNQFLESFPKKSIYCFAKEENTENKNCIRGNKFDFYSDNKSKSFNIFNYSNIEKKYFLSEHGIGEHFKYINKYFSGYSNIYSLILKVENTYFVNTKDVFNNIKDYNFGDGDILFIASVDFSHHVIEPIALFHDMKTVEELNKDKFLGAEVDCPNCLYLLKKLANKNNKIYFKMGMRTSSTEIVGKEVGYENTSHIFGEFIESNLEENNNISLFSKKYEETIFENKEDAGDGAIYGMFFGDTHLTRGFENSKSFKDKRKYLKCFYQNKDIDKDPKYWQNRMFSSFDFVGVNLETSLCKRKYCQKSGKFITFQSNPEDLKLFKNIGINLFNLSNNHSYDCGNICFSKGKKSIEKLGMNYFGEGRGNESNIFKTTHNGLKIAFIGINDTSFSWDLGNKIKKIEKLRKEGYIIIINIHSGIEYQKIGNAWQRKFARKLIDAGANMIIGHHPHMVQNYEIYKGAPIFYSLGNFIFDQPFENTLKGMGIVYRIDNKGVKFNRIYFKRNPKDYGIICDSFNSEDNYNLWEEKEKEREREL